MQIKNGHDCGPDYQHDSNKASDRRVHGFTLRFATLGRASHVYPNSYGRSIPGLSEASHPTVGSMGGSSLATKVRANVKQHSRESTNDRDRSNTCRVWIGTLASDKILRKITAINSLDVVIVDRYQAPKINLVDLEVIIVGGHKPAVVIASMAQLHGNVLVESNEFQLMPYLHRM